MKIIIYLDGHPNTHGHSRLQFKWSTEYACYLYQGKVFEDAKEFNEACRASTSGPNAQIFRRLGWAINVKILEAGPTFMQPPAPTVPDITMAQAEEVLERLAPHRLKKKPGPRADLQLEPAGAHA